MANTTSAKKATRKIARRTIINKSRRTQMRGAVRTVEEAIKNGDRDGIPVALMMTGPVIAALLGWTLKDDAEARNEGSELIALNR